MIRIALATPRRGRRAARRGGLSRARRERAERSERVQPRTRRPTSPRCWRPSASPSLDDAVRATCRRPCASARRIDLAPGLTEPELRAHLEAPRRPQHAASPATPCSSAPARTRTWRPTVVEPDTAALGVRHGVHAVPARGEPGHAAGDLRVPDVRGAAARSRRREREHVRRRVGGGRGGADGAAAASRAPRRAGLARAASALPRHASRPTCAASATSTCARCRSPPTAGPTWRRCAPRSAPDTPVRRPRLSERLRRDRGRRAASRALAHGAGALDHHRDARAARARAAAIARRAAAPTSRWPRGRASGCRSSYGGPGVGLFATREAHLRSMPGRIVGETRRRARAGAASCSRSRRASSTSAASARRRTSARTRVCARSR